MSEFRVLVVEDYEPYRRFICSTLGERPDLQVVGEVSDGLQAVSTAQRLRPDLILLDVGLPTLNGIQAARRIREVSPNSKILFVSQESSAEIVQEAFRIGALAYVSKTRSGIDLLAAIDAVSRGVHFVSEGLAGPVPLRRADRKPNQRFSEDEVFSTAPGARN